jgi:hypothetical protein
MIPPDSSRPVTLPDKFLGNPLLALGELVVSSVASSHSQQSDCVLSFEFCHPANSFSLQAPPSPLSARAYVHASRRLAHPIPLYKYWTPDDLDPTDPQLQ